MMERAVRRSDWERGTERLGCKKERLRGREEGLTEKKDTELKKRTWTERSLIQIEHMMVYLRGWNIHALTFLKYDWKLHNAGLFHLPEGELGTCCRTSRDEHCTYSPAMKEQRCGISLSYSFTNNMDKRCSERRKEEAAAWTSLHYRHKRWGVVARRGGVRELVVESGDW